MKNWIFFLAISAVSFYGKTQSLDFPTENAKWQFRYQSEGGAPYEIHEHLFLGDSLYNNVAYKIITHVNDILGGQRSLLRTEGNQVFLIPYADSLEYLLYDFNLEIGDTFLVPQYYLIGIISEAIEVSNIHVDSSAFSQTGYRKIWSFENSYVRWIEGIGSDYGSIVTPWYFFPPNESSFLECFTVDSIDILGENCSDFLDDVSNFGKEILEVNVFPNPFSNQINIETNSSKSLEALHLYNINGQLIHSVKGQSQIQLTQNLPCGAYYLKIVVGDQSFYRKVVK